jgi:hypothetical protein
MADAGPVLSLGGLELRLAHSLTTESTEYTLEGRLQGRGAELFCDGGSLLIQNPQTGLVEEAFFSSDGHFAQSLALEPDNDTPLVLALCDGLSTVAATVPVTLRHRGLAAAGTPAPATVPRPIAIEVLTRAGQRRRQVLAPAGVRLPGKFSCVCRTTDQSGRVIVPLWEEERLIKEVTVDEIDPRLPIGTAVEVELQMAADRAISVRVLVRQAGRGEVLEVPPPTPPTTLGAEQIAELVSGTEALLTRFTGQYGQELQDGFTARRSALQAAADAGNVDKAAALFAELQALREQMLLAPALIRYPPFQRLTQMVKRCLFEAADLADRTGRDREQLFAPIYVQEQVAEKAHAEKDVRRYREALDNLNALAADLERAQADVTPPSQRGSGRVPTGHDVTDAVKDLQAYLSAVVSAAELKNRADFVKQLQELQGQCDAWADRGKREPAQALRDLRKALAAAAQMEQLLTSGFSRSTTAAGIEGMLEGSLGG